MVEFIVQALIVALSGAAGALLTINISGICSNQKLALHDQKHFSESQSLSKEHAMISKEVAASSERIIQSLAAISEDIHEVRERQVEELARQEIVLKRLAENEQLRMENLRFQ